MGKTPAELMDGLSSEEFTEFQVLNDPDPGAEAAGEPEMDPAEFVKRTSG